MGPLDTSAFLDGAVLLVDSAPIIDTLEVAESAARIRSAYGLKLPDAIQAASALAINADALVTHDRDFSKLRGIKVLT